MRDDFLGLVWEQRKQSFIGGIEVQMCCKQIFCQQYSKMIFYASKEIKDTDQVIQYFKISHSVMHIFTVSNPSYNALTFF